MYIASMEGNPAVAKMLIQHGADTNRKDKEGKTVLMVSGKEYTVLIIEMHFRSVSSHVIAGGTEWS